ncbi:hypothetical protein FQY83_14750 [Luteimonas marina]|uniref:Uncharacterized protein n=1 Tax=Luteimonas marina TaxID=488485 RepID=A0A5C5TZA9_9GAMM|nr:hypothetical protein [Luteimonas marina]TWT18632.1 hypothetical protein FQY83_14750 [Luteimonas marina]
MLLPTPLRPLVVALSIAALAAGCNASPPANEATGATASSAPEEVREESPSADQLGMAMRHYGELLRMRALGERCDWIAAAEQAALAATIDERRAWLTSWQADPTKVESETQPLLDSEAALECAGPPAGRLKAGIDMAVWQMRITWALRAQALLDGPGRPDWFSGRSSVNEHRAAVEEAVEGLKTNHRADIEAAQPGFRLEAERMMLAARCPGSDQACPKGAAAAPALHDYAEAWVSGAEAYAAVLPTVEDKAGQRPLGD